MFFPLFSGPQSELRRRRRRRSGRYADEPVLLRRPARGWCDRIVVAYGDYFIHYASIVNFGDESGPMPCILCGPGFPPESTGESCGSTATIRTAGLCFFNAFPDNR